MSMPVNILPAAPHANADLDQIKRAGDGSIESEKARLRKATEEFESFFMYQMLKAMRKTIPESTLGEGAPMSGGLGKETFTEFFDMEIARKAVIGGHNSIADIMYNSMEKLIDAQFNVPAPDATLMPLHPEPAAPLKLHRIEPKVLPSKAEPIKLDRSQHGLPMPVVRRTAPVDPIMRDFGKFIIEAARETKLDSALISSVIRAESNGNPAAVSKAGAKGLMQLMDSTARELNVRDPFDPRENIRAGSRYLRQMLDKFGDVKLALAAYNAGPGNVTKHGGMPPFRETAKYVQRVTQFMESVGVK